MEATLENIDSCEVLVTVTVPGDEYKTELDSNFKRLSQTVNMKGFRPGKVPKSVIEKHHGEELRRDTKQQFVQQGLQKVVTDEELRPVGQPSKYLMFLPALALLGGVVFLQLGRTRRKDAKAAAA